ncbi:MAG: glycosyltransferase [Candidatus Buchananbacteria bacterium]|nr:glycosyltransferase [Candidatus Buchananbacteria bacterium]
MKIAFFSDNFYPELSGISDSIIALAKELAKRGHEINFYVPKYQPKDYNVANLPKQELDLGNNIKIHRLFSFPYPTATGQSRLVSPIFLSLFGIKKFSPDIIHSQLFFGVGLEALFSAKLNKIPLVGTNHTAITEFLHYSPIKAKWVQNLMLKYVVWYYNQCDYVSAPSQSVFTEMSELGFYRPHKAISNPIDLEIFSEKSKIEGEAEEIKKKFQLSDNTIIYAGRLAAEKNIDVIIRAIAIVKEKIPTINFAIAGHGSALTFLKNLAKELFIEDRIKFLGTLDKETLAKVYRASKIFVITSTSETQSMTLMQAMGCRLPVIGVKARALPEYINHKNGFLIEINDHVALANKIIFLLKDDNMRKKLSTGSLDFVQQYSVKNIANQWEKIYQNLIKT